MSWPLGMTLRVVIPSGALATVPLAWFLKDLDEIRVACKRLSRYEYDNNHQVLSFDCYATEFSFSVALPQAAPGSPNERAWLSRFGDAYRDRALGVRVTEFNLWDWRGCIAVHKEVFLGDLMKPIPDEVRARLCAAMRAYVDGSLRCSDCGAMLPMVELPGAYFAGRYCAACWLGERGKHSGSGGWKAVESRETYD